MTPQDAAALLNMSSNSISLLAIAVAAWSLRRFVASVDKLTDNVGKINERLAKVEAHVGIENDS
jgi:hypothetical protein